MEVTNLQNQIQSIEQQLRDREIKLSISESSKEKFELEIEQLHQHLKLVESKNSGLKNERIRNATEPSE